MDKIELLAPAGNLDRLKIAFAYGADAVYVGGEAFSLRTAAKNFSQEDLKRGVEYAHQRGKKLYVAANVIAHNDEIDAFPAFLEEMNRIGPDALIISDPGAFTLARGLAPEIPVHISTQANNVNYRTVNFWHKLGAKRVVLARELSFAEMAEIRAKTSQELELEAFVHGAMCISYSGRCLLSSYMTGRDSNRGDCAHPCRWSYALMEEKRPGEYFPIDEDGRRSYILNSKDLCLIGSIPELVKSGIASFKIEGRVKTEYYVATVVKAYRNAIDSYLADPEGWELKPEWLEELGKISNRGYTTGFSAGNPSSNAQEYENGGYVRTYDIAAIAAGYDEATGEMLFEQKNKISAGDKLEVLTPEGAPFPYQIQKMRDAEGNEIDSAPHPKQRIRLSFGKPLPDFTILRKKN